MLTLIDGKLRIFDGSLVLSDSADDPCCCPYQCSDDSSISEFGLLDSQNYGWSIKDPKKLPTSLPITMNFKFEDSANCQGQNPNPQYGNVTACLFLRKRTEIEIEVSGAVELQNFGYDGSSVGIGGVSVGIGSIGEGKGCEMRSVSDKKSITLDAGEHAFTFSTSTNDGLFHVGMTHTFKISKK